MYSFDAFYDLPSGTKFFIRGEWYIKLAPYGGDIGCCALVSLSDGRVTHATELWPMHEYKVDMDVSDIAAFNPKFDKVVETFSWEKDLFSAGNFPVSSFPLFQSEESDWHDSEATKSWLDDYQQEYQDFVDHANQVFAEENECHCEACCNEDLDDYNQSQSQSYEDESQYQGDQNDNPTQIIPPFIGFTGYPDYQMMAFSTLKEALEYMGIDIPSDYDAEEEERKYMDFRRRMGDQNP